MSVAEGGCLCGEVRYSVDTKPTRITICHCKFCQRATGSAYLVEPIFNQENFHIETGNPSTYEHVSEGSGKLVYVHFCKICGTKLYLSFERFSDAVGVYAGTFDDPNWLEITPENSKQIFLSEAQHSTIIPAGVNTFAEHATLNDGTPIEPSVYSEPKTIKP